MANPIIMISEAEYRLDAHGCQFTLKKERGQWAMYTVNAAVRAWNRGFASPKFFATLLDVEKKYRAWRGIAALADI